MKLDENTKETMVDIWASMFENEPYEVVVTAVKNHITNDTKGFLPLIGAIKEQIYKTSNPDQPTEMEAWNHVVKALRKAYYEPNKAWNTLSEIEQRIVGSANQLQQWSLMSLDALGSVVSSNFQRTYRALATKQKDIIKINPLLLGKKKMEEIE